MKPFKTITCATCSGHGVVDKGYHNPGECQDCNGSGQNVRYESGAIAKHYGGPLLSGPSNKAEASPS